MHQRKIRHQSNLRQPIGSRGYEAAPKFYNHVRKYGWDSFDFGCLLESLNYFEAFDESFLSPEEKQFLTNLTQWDLLVTEQFFIDTFGLSLNVCPKVGTRESSILSSNT